LAFVATTVVGAGAFSRNLELVELSGGLTLMVVAILTGISLGRLAQSATTPGKLVRVNLFLTAVVVVALVGVTLMGLPLTNG
jgi:hypothetical protein